MKTPINYWGGKQKLARHILKILPKHNLYCEPFFGGGAVFFAKEKSPVEVINDKNREVINFFKVLQQDFDNLSNLIQASLHSRALHADANTILANLHLFSEVQRAWALWASTIMGFSSKIANSFGYGRKDNSTEKKTRNKRVMFSKTDYVTRLQDVQIECIDALRVIQTRDTNDSLFYCDPPYIGAAMSHYAGYTETDFKNLLETLANIKGKFILSSYPSPLLDSYIKNNRWRSIEHTMELVAGKGKAKQTGRTKTEVITTNFSIR